jgi:hypothetical protein
MPPKGSRRSTGSSAGPPSKRLKPAEVLQPAEVPEPPVDPGAATGAAPVLRRSGVGPVGPVSSSSSLGSVSSPATKAAKAAKDANLTTAHAAADAAAVQSVGQVIAKGRVAPTSKAKAAPATKATTPAPPAAHAAAATAVPATAAPEGVDVRVFCADECGPFDELYHSTAETYEDILNKFCEQNEFTMQEVRFKAVDGSPITAETPLVRGPAIPINICAEPDGMEMEWPPADGFAAPALAPATPGSVSPTAADAAAATSMADEHDVEVCFIDTAGPDSMSYRSSSYRNIIDAFLAETNQTHDEVDFKDEAGIIITGDTPLKNGGRIFATPRGAAPAPAAATTPQAPVAVEAAATQATLGIDEEEAFVDACSAGPAGPAGDASSVSSKSSVSSLSSVSFVEARPAAPTDVPPSDGHKRRAPRLWLSGRIRVNRQRSAGPAQPASPGAPAAGATGPATPSADAAGRIAGPGAYAIKDEDQEAQRAPHGLRGCCMSVVARCAFNCTVCVQLHL